MINEKEQFPEMPEESVWELIGDVATYNTSDFKEAGEIKYRATEVINLYSMFDIDYAEETDFVLPSGSVFSVVGISEEHEMYLISYGSELFGCDISDVEYSSVEVTE